MITAAARIDNEPRLDTGIEASLLLAALAAPATASTTVTAGDFLARAKNRTAPIPGFPWWQALTAHAAMHSGRPPVGQADADSVAAADENEAMPTNDM